VARYSDSQEIAMKIALDCCRLPSRALRAAAHAQVRDRRRCARCPGAWGRWNQPPALAKTLTEEERDKLTPSRYWSCWNAKRRALPHRQDAPHDYLAQKRDAHRATPGRGDTELHRLRAPAEIIFEVGVGDTFKLAGAGNIANDDLGWAA
jgi:hypothetical protein